MKFIEKFREINKLDSFGKCRETQKIVQEEGDFGYTKIVDIMSDLNDEVAELKEEIFLENNVERIGSELGDVLFVLCNLAEKFDIDLPNVLNDSTDEFQRRIAYIESKISGKSFKNLTKEERKSLWKEAKLNR